MKPISGNIHTYLESSIAIDRDHPAIIDRAMQITAGLDTDILKEKHPSKV